MKSEMNDILKLLTIIANSEDGASIRELHRKTEIPVEVIKENLENLWYNAELYLIDLAPEDEEGYEEASGNCLDFKWSIGNFDENTKVLSLNHFERYLYKNILTKSENSGSDILGIKTKSTYDIEDYKFKLCQISLAVESRRALKAKYKTRTSKIEEFIIMPLGIVFYEFENLFYVVGQYDNNIVTYRLDRIESLGPHKDSFTPIEGFDLKKYISNVWGMEQGEPVQIKIKFLKAGNVFYRVRRDLECRQNKKLTEFEDYIVYEDTIVGINSFKNWLRSFGSSAVVIEPEELRKEMIDSAKRSLAYYRGEETNE